MNRFLIMPRAIQGFGVRAEEKPEELFRQLRDSIESFKAQHNSRLDNIEAAMNAIGAGPHISATFGEA